MTETSTQTSNLVAEGAEKAADADGLVAKNMDAPEIKRKAVAKTLIEGKNRTGKVGGIKAENRRAIGIGFRQLVSAFLLCCFTD